MAGGSQSINLFGVDEGKRGFEFNKDRMIAAINSALYSAANDILTEANNLVPIDTGNLKSTGVVTTNGAQNIPPSPTDLRPKLDISFGGKTTGSDGANYAAVQHERLDYNHPQGGQAKYLEQPFLEETSRWPAKLVSRIRVEYHT